MHNTLTCYQKYIVYDHGAPQDGADRAPYFITINSVIAYDYRTDISDRHGGFLLSYRR